MLFSAALARSWVPVQEPQMADTHTHKGGCYESREKCANRFMCAQKIIGGRVGGVGAAVGGAQLLHWARPTERLNPKVNRGRPDETLASGKAAHKSADLERQGGSGEETAPGERHADLRFLGCQGRGEKKSRRGKEAKLLFTRKGGFLGGLRLVVSPGRRGPRPDRRSAVLRRTYRRRDAIKGARLV